MKNLRNEDERVAHPCGKLNIWPVNSFFKTFYSSYFSKEKAQLEILLFIVISCLLHKGDSIKHQVQYECQPKSANM
jgi:hypothetical protein